MLSAVHLQCDFLTDPINIGHTAPLLTWQIRSSLAGTVQKACHIRAYILGPEGINELLWDTGRIETMQQSRIYSGKIPEADRKVIWQLRVWDNKGQESAWQEASWQRAMAPEEWQAEWIGFDRGRDQYDPTVPYYCADDYQKGENHPFLPEPALMRHEFSLEEKPLSAVLYVTALGLTKVGINGKEAAPNCLLPGVCDFTKRCNGFVFDVTGLLQEGKNALSAVLADGWYAGYIGLNPREWWGSKPRLRAEVHLTYQNGRTETVCTGEIWKCKTGPWLYADIMHGCGYDARLEPKGWELPGFDDRDWEKPDIGIGQEIPVVIHPGVPVTEGTPILPVRIRDDGREGLLIDFGKCISGVVRLTLKGKRGAEAHLYHAEELLRDGSDLFYDGNRSAQAHDCYILNGEGEEHFCPRFTYHGFRYARLRISGDACLIRAEAVPLSSYLEGKTRLSTGHDIVNRVSEMIFNTAECNMVDIVTDVCARDERLGWGCEGNLFMHTAAAFGHTARFLRKWLQDALDGQQEDGGFWAIAPAVMMRDIQPFVGDLQSDIALHCCWLLMMHYDDRQSVEKAYPALQRYLDYQVRNSDRYLRFATARDWLDLNHNGRSDTDHGYGCCDPTLIGTGWFAVDALMMDKLASFLGKAEDAERYRELYNQIRKAFRTFFLGRDHLLRGCTQGGYMLAAVAGLLEREEREAARRWVVEDMQKCGGITWGTATTPIALHGMCCLGLEKEASAFLRRDTYPSIGYMYRCGATTVWERWDAVMDNCFHPHQMNAFSHIGLATVGEWMVSRMAGIQPASPGYRDVLLKPVFDREMGFAEAVYECPFGPIHVKWKFEGDCIHYLAELPEGTRGTLVLPYPAQKITREGTEANEWIPETDGTETKLRLESGSHELVIRFR